MSKKIVEGLWDCKYCDTKAIGGLTKHCPGCGHPQDQDTKFYMGEKKNYLEEELAEQYGQGADWVCEYCGSLNRFHYKYCANCSSPKETSEKDYFTAKAEPEKEQDNSGEHIKKKKAKKKNNNNNNNNKKGGKKKRWIILSIAAVLIFSLFYSLWPKTYDATVSDMSWERQIDIEDYRTVKESDWTVPEGGRVYDEKTEISHYEQVLDHYETRTRQVSEEVYDGEDYYTTYRDNGDGTFTEETHSTPRYRTEWRTETYQEPIYRDEPVYGTKYYYEIEKWVVDRTEKSKGKSKEPYWPEYKLKGVERTGDKKEKYVIELETEDGSYTVTVPYDVWEKYHVKDETEIWVTKNEVTRIGNDEIE